MFKNGNTWPSIISVLLTILIIILGFLVAKVDSIAESIHIMETKVGVTEERLNNHINTQWQSEQSWNIRYAEKEWVRRNFVEK